MTKAVILPVARSSCMCVQPAIMFDFFLGDGECNSPLINVSIPWV